MGKVQCKILHLPVDDRGQDLPECEPVRIGDEDRRRTLRSPFEEHKAFLETAASAVAD
jgi:hypothetical protein